MAHEHEKLIKCPYCDHEWKDSWEFVEDEGTHTCGSCDKEFNVFRYIEINYSTSKIECEENDHNYQTDSYFIRKKKYIKSGVWSDIPEENWNYLRIDECLKCDDREHIEITKEEYFRAVEKV